MEPRKKILFVAFTNSIHTARWIAQLSELDWDIHIFPSQGGAVIHPSLVNVTVHHLLYSQRVHSSMDVKDALPSRFAVWIDRIRTHIIDKRFPRLRIAHLSKVISRLKPDIVHSLEIQAAGYLTLGAKKQFRGTFPPWLVTNWGSDIFLFGRLSEHKAKIHDVLANCDYYSCECERDVKLAKHFGFGGLTMPVFPNTGGFDLASLQIERNCTPTSSRRLILIKGYQNWAGRALVGLRALSRCRDILGGYTVAVYSAYPDVVIAAELFSDETGVPVQIIPNNTSHQGILSLHAQARVSIGLSISDAISTSFLEAMVMGSFPIQSCTACAEEWIEHSISGMIVPPEDPDIIEMAIRTALSDDELVNKAAQLNWLTAQDRLDGSLLREKTINMYSELF